MAHVVVDDVVVTKHPASLRTADLAVRLTAATTDPIRPLYAAPLAATPLAAPDGHLITLEPRLEPPGERPPWREIGSLIARLQACPVPAGLPEHAGRALLTDAVARADRLHAGGPTDILRELGRTLLRTWPTASEPVLVHGALTLATVGRVPGTPSWLLSDPSTLGFGGPAWDLGAPAGMWAAGLLDTASWEACVDGYAEAGGALPDAGDPWDALDHPARCWVYLTAVRQVAASGDYPDTEFSPQTQALLDACVRMNGRSW